ncbi:ABC transporter permease [Aliidiomarina minuta]|uniref:ABC transporter permease n=1 Tax=Aliidiomarina minuta TaxID=880057 RepID=A0A432W6R3_9GAMM|nr:ABC transporter permease [Aliidiomarina minuta]RUO25758.1 ABC transporter permease [Aliidiomarina minuta]
MSGSERAGCLTIDDSQRPSTIKLSGHWVIDYYAQLQQALHKLPEGQDYTLDISAVEKLDTAGVHLLHQAFGEQQLRLLAADDSPLDVAQKRLLQVVVDASDKGPTITPKQYGDISEILQRIGKVSADIWHQQIAILGFIGVTLQSLAATCWRPSRWRKTALVAHLEYTGLNAVPIVALLTFLVGAVVAFLGATVLEQFGAGIYTVNLIGFSFLREFGVLLAAILLAGRTASAFTAQLGSMKANEEIDAIRSLGLSPIELLVLPRVLAMMISLPVLTFIGMLSGIAGGMVVCMLALDISPALFMHIFSRDIEVSHFWVGMIKAPVFAFIIAIIGCLEGFKVSGSAQSVGEHTTSSVVQSIFMVILLDALFALFFMEIGW